MEYILISMLTIAFFTYIVTVVANKVLAIPIHMKSLVLCACCALLISLILPRMFMSFAGLRGTLGILIVFAMISSYLIAYYYDSAMQKVALKEDVTTKLAEFSFSRTPSVEKIEVSNFTADRATTLPTNNVEDIMDNSEINNNLTSIEEFISNEEREEVQQDLPPIALEINDNDQIYHPKDAIENIIQLEELPTVAVEKTYYYPMKCEENKIETEVYNNLMDVEEQVAVTTTLPILETIQERLDLPNSKESSVINEIIMPPDVTHVDSERPMNEELQKSIDDPQDILPEQVDSEVLPDPYSQDLDVLMDFAFAHKEQRNFRQALTTFRQALLLYPDSEVAPFLVVEIGTIFKNFGSYNEAIQIFIEGRLLPGIINNNILEQEFINNIAYLRVVKNILVQNHLEFMPFSLIPETALKEINDEFCAWRNQS